MPKPERGGMPSEEVKIEEEKPATEEESGVVEDEIIENGVSKEKEDRMIDDPDYWEELEFDKENSFWVHPLTGRTWSTVNNLSKKLDIHGKTFEKYTKNVTRLRLPETARIPGFIKGVSRVLFDVEETEIALENFLSRKIIDRDTQIYKDPESGRSFASPNYFMEKFNITNVLLNKLSKGVSKIDGRGVRGAPTVLYDIEEFEDVNKDYLSRFLVNRETGVYEDEHGRKFTYPKAIQRKWKLLTNDKFKRLLRGLKPLPGRNAYGVCDLYDIEEFEKKNKDYLSLLVVEFKNRIYTDENGVKWTHGRYFRDKYSIQNKMFKRYMVKGKVPTINVRGKAKEGKLVLYNIEKALEAMKDFFNKIRAGIDGKYVDTEDVGWGTQDYFKERYGISRNAFLNRVKNVSKIKDAIDHTGHHSTLYKIDEVVDSLEDKYINRYDDQKEISIFTDKDNVEWAPVGYFVKFFGILKDEFISFSSNTKTKQGKTPHSSQITLYHLDESLKLVEEYISQFDIDEKAGVYIDKYTGEKYLTLGYFIKNFDDITPAIIKKYTKMVSSVPRGKGHTYNARLYNLKELNQKLESYRSRYRVDEKTGIYTDEDGLEWTYQRNLLNMFGGLSFDFFRDGVEGLPTLPGIVHGYEVDLYRIIDIKSRIGRADSKEFINFVSDIADGISPDAERFRTLLNILGSSRCVDILYKFRPEYGGLPVEYVKGVLADYLGDFLVTKGEFNFRDIAVAREYLSDMTLRQGLYETIKDNCLRYYFQQKQAGSTESSVDIIYGYIDHISDGLEDVRTEEIDDIIQDVIEYYDSVLREFHKPECFVEALSEDREFPDINQRINMKELADKKRLLIADEMGLGKSASVIMAKEQLGVKCAVVIAPSNVIETWQRYLSDDSENGGYYQKGQAPRVLVVENPGHLKGIDADSYDYILISQEKMTKKYSSVLKEIDYDMMVIDEVHKLKNLRGKRTENVMDLASKVEGGDKYLAMLSGTPVPNKVEDIALILKLLYPDKFAHVSDREFVRQIIQGDIVDLRSLLLPYMQMKSLEEGLEMPPLTESIVDIELSDIEKEVYEVLIEDDEMEPVEKMRLLRKFLLNPELLDSTPNIESTKIREVSKNISEAFNKHDKILLFVNDYIEGVIRGEKSILKHFELPDGVEVRVIHGEVGKDIRELIQKEFNKSKGRVLLIVSGQTADVGVDLSGGDRVFFYNEPWTEYQRRQELGRTYRPGVKHAIESSTFITNETIEEGFHQYILRKYKVVEKLLKGVPISELEKEMLKKAETAKSPDIEVNPELARHYFSSWDKMMQIFAYVKEIGEEKFSKFLEKYARDYAGAYIDLGNRSYQANANRVCGTVIHESASQRGEDASSLRILDLGSGPEMLKQHIGNQYQNQVTSLDINRHHFKHKEARGVVASLGELPFANSSFDYANFSLSWHYTDFVPSKNRLERVEALAEINRILKVGGRTTLNLIYSLELRDFKKFEQAIDALGFKIVKEYTGEVAEGSEYQSYVITLEKVREIDGDIDQIMKNIGKTNYDGFKFEKQKRGLKNSRKIISSFALAGRHLDVNFNSEDKEVLEEEQSLLRQAEALRNKYGGVAKIPKNEIIDNGFIRILVGEKYILFKKLEKGSGVVVIK